MASESTSDLEVLNELLDETKELEAPQGDVGYADVSAEDVLQQLDSVALSLEADDGVEETHDGEATDVPVLSTVGEDLNPEMNTTETEGYQVSTISKEESAGEEMEETVEETFADAMEERDELAVISGEGEPLYDTLTALESVDVLDKVLEMPVDDDTNVALSASDFTDVVTQSSSTAGDLDCEDEVPTQPHDKPLEALSEQNSPEVEPRPQVLSEDGSVEGFDPPLVNDVLPPPTPIVAPLQPVFSGSLNPLNSASNGFNVTEDGGEDDSDTDVDDDEVTGPPPPLALEVPLNDDDDELEVDLAVAETIQTFKTTEPGVKATNDRVDAPSNPLLDALGRLDLVSKENTEKTDNFAMSFDDPVEVRTAQVTTAPTAHPESSAVVFGIGYQSLRKRLDRDGSAGGDDAYSIMKGPTFHDLESEVTLTSDVSLSQCQTDPSMDMEEDEFGKIPEVSIAASPTRVEAILQKTHLSFAMRSAADEEAELVAELKKITVHEKRHLHDTNTPIENKTNDDNALTLKELHSIYKRGLGDQEVCLLDDDTDAPTANARDDERNEEPVMLNMPSLQTQAIAEEDEGSQDEDNDDDAEVVAIESERMTIRENSTNAASHEELSEWKEIELLHEVSTIAQTSSAEVSSCSRISYAEALLYFLESEDVLVHRDRIVAEEKPPSSSCFSCFARPRLAFNGAIEQRDRFFCVAATSFNARNAVHVRILQTIHRKLLNGGIRDVPLMGSHWESIGFQGTDPSTDLRGCGVLSLLQMLYVVESHAEFARRFHTISQHPTRHFPLACALINVTLQCVMALRSGGLYKESNKQGSVFGAANTLHVAIATQLMKEIQATNEPIPLVMKRVLDHGRQRPDRVIEAYTSSKGALEEVGSASTQPQPLRKASATTGRASSSRAAGEFTEIGLHSIADD